MFRQAARKAFSVQINLFVLKRKLINDMRKLVKLKVPLNKKLQLVKKLIHYHFRSNELVSI